MPATADEKAIHQLEVRLAEISTSLSFIKWIGTFLAGCAVALLVFFYQAGQRVTRIEDAVVALQKDFAEVKSDLKGVAEIKPQLDRIERSLAHNPKPTP
jgi:hypothetical protein